MRIIAKIAPFFIVLLSLILRLYNIEQFAEFLGDQGRTGIIVYEAWRDRTIPLIGPTVLTGQHLGPAWYYLIGPFYILSRFNPLGPAVGMALYGALATLTLYLLTKKLYGPFIGSLVALLWSVSPLIVRQDQTIWEPNLVPLFVLVFLLGLKNRNYLLLWGACGVLVQLHIPNIIFIPIAIVVSRRWKPAFAGVLLFLLIQVPFFVYETQHGFRDIVGVMNVMSQPSAFSKTQFLMSFIDYTSRVFFRAIPTGNQVAMIVIQLMLGLLLLVSKSRWNIFLLAIFVFGIAAMARYQGLVHDHYLNFLLPFPFLFIANGLRIVHKYSKLGTVLVGSILIIWQITKPGYFPQPRGDIDRVGEGASAIVQDAQGFSYSFTVIGSPSFNDLHYRYFFLLNHSVPADIRTHNVDKLYVICEIGNMCPNLDQHAVINVMCFDAHCEGEYPKLNLWEWNYEKIIPVGSSFIFVFGTIKA